MIYTKEDIKFEQISPKAFENLCYDLLVKYSFKNIIWRDGAGDNGRDIEASYDFNNPIRSKETKWFFECKHYTSGGVPPEHLNSKIAWADAENPAFLVLFISSYLTNNARTWMEKLLPHKKYDIICIEGEALKDMLVNHSDLIECYFSLDRYEKMLRDIKDYRAKFNISPSFEFLKEVIENIDLEKLEANDIGFILFSFYDQYSFFEKRNDIYSDFNVKIVYRLLEYLKYNLENEYLKSFEEYKNDYDELGGEGIFDEMFWLDEEDRMENMRALDFQFYILHLNHTKDYSFWKTGRYLFLIYNDVAFELFSVDKTEIRIIKNFKPEIINEISLNMRDDIVERYNLYLERITGN